MLKEKVFKAVKKDYSAEEIINLILYMVIIVMPFILNKYQKPMYMTGKLYFLLSVGVLLIVFGWKTIFKDMKVEHKISIVFLLSFVVATICSPVKEVALFGNYDRGEGLIMYCIYIMLFILSSKYLVVNRKMVLVILSTASIMSIYAIFQFYGIDPVQSWLLGEVKNASSFSFIGNRNFFSSYICIFLFISMAIYILKGSRKYLILSMPLFSGLLCSLTRGGWVAFIIYSILGLIFIYKDKECLKRATIIFIVFLICFLTINITSGNKVLGRISKSNIVSEEGEIIGSAGARVEILKISFNSFLDSPLIGFGPDTLKFRLNSDYPDEHSSYIVKHGTSIDKAHNEYLEYAVSGGIFTLISYLAIIILIIKGLLNRKKDYKNIVMILVISGYLVQAFFNISVIMVAPIFWILLGYATRLKYES